MDIYDLMASGDKAERLFHLRNQIENILTSYDDDFDGISEMVQNSLDAVLERGGGEAEYKATLKIIIDCNHNRITVIDNGCGVSSANFSAVFKPNISLKKRLGHKSSRGEKGAGIVFLQFANSAFEFHSKQNADVNSYCLSSGNEWFEKFSSAIDKGGEGSDHFPVANITLGNTVDPALEHFSSGSVTRITLPSNSETLSCALISGENIDTALNRWEYILRTRTAIGFFSRDASGLPAQLANIDINLEIHTASGQKKNKQIEFGFLFPHKMSPKGKIFSLMTNPKTNSALLYDFMNNDFIKNYLSTYQPSLSQSRFQSVIIKYQLTGYIAYAHDNTFYEDDFKAHLGFDDASWDESDLPHRMIQINGGFKVSVREFPNGRLHSFLQRGGSENKSRTFVVFNFGNEYKPDYGRKNLAHDCRELVNTISKAVMAFSTTGARREKLKMKKGGGTHGVTDQFAAKQIIDEQTKGAMSNGAFYRPGFPFPARKPQSESEVILNFFHLLKSGKFPGVTVYGPSDTNMFDAVVDVTLENQADYWYHAEDNPFGVILKSGKQERYVGQTLEFKSTLPKLIEDLQTADGASASKYFNYLHYCVCQQVDDNFEGYHVLEISDANDNISRRTIVGATHILSQVGGNDHYVQVICLNSIK